MIFCRNQLPCSWDTFDVYLFDIDGTLLHCTDAVHYFAFCNALELIAGRPLNLDGVTAHGNTDIGILRDAFALAGVAEEQWRPHLPNIRKAMCDYVQSRQQELCATVLPNVLQILEHLHRRGAVLGVATGNLESIGQLKLQRAGLLSYFQFGGWSDAFESRPDVLKAAVVKARGIAGEGASICAVGDTPADIDSAHRNGLPVIAIATGVYPYTELLAEGPDLCIHSLQDLLPAAHPLPA